MSLFRCRIETRMHLFQRFLWVTVCHFHVTLIHMTRLNIKMLIKRNDTMQDIIRLIKNIA